MKIKFFLTGLLGLATVTAFAQKAEVASAQSDLTKYQTLLGNKTMVKLAEASLVSAKTSIDKAAVNEKTSGLPQTQAVKAAVYAEFALKDTVPATSIPYFTTADEAVKKAKELDVKGENKKLIDATFLSLAQYQLNKGVKEYTAKKYDLAYKSFDYYREVLPEDTVAIYYTGLAAAQSNNFDAAITNYKKLLTTNYTQKVNLYGDLTYYLMAKKDTAGAMKNLEEAAAKYPNDPSFSKRIIEMNLAMGKQKEVLTKIEGAIANDPKNKTLYYYGGVTYTQVGEEAAKKLKGNKDVAEIASLTKVRDENFGKAVELYKKALAIDPEYFDVNLNIGYLLINPAIDIYNSAGKIPVEKQKEYDAAIAKSNAMFEVAKPYLLKAVELKPTSIDALNNLRTYYLGKKDAAKASELKKSIEDLQAAKK